MSRQASALARVWRSLGRNATMRLCLLLIGCAMLILAPLVGLLPGPGGFVVAGVGLSLALKNSAWAKRRYVRFKRRRPGAGGWSDWMLRRRSAKRRAALEKGAEKALENTHERLSG